MKTTIIAGLDNLTFSSADMIDPKALKLVGMATAIEQAWNIYDVNGEVKRDMAELPVMPIEAAAGFEPDCIVIAAASREDDENVKYMLFRSDYRGEVISLFELFSQFSPKTAALRKMAWRLDELGVEGAAADLGCGYGDVSWQLNALMPERKLYLFDTFTGYDQRDIEQEKELSDAKAGQFAYSPQELENAQERLLLRMPAPERVSVMQGWFPETAMELESEKYALVHIDTGLYAPTYAGIQYFLPRMSKGGVIFVSGYEDGKSISVRKAIADLEKKYGAFLMTPLCDLEGTIMITRP